MVRLITSEGTSEVEYVSSSETIILIPTETAIADDGIVRLTINEVVDLTTTEELSQYDTEVGAEEELTLAPVEVGVASHLDQSVEDITLVAAETNEINIISPVETLVVVTTEPVTLDEFVSICDYCAGGPEGFLVPVETAQADDGDIFVDVDEQREKLRHTGLERAGVSLLLDLEVDGSLETVEAARISLASTETVALTIPESPHIGANSTSLIEKAVLKLVEGSRFAASLTSTESKYLYPHEWSLYIEDQHRIISHEVTRLISLESKSVELPLDRSEIFLLEPIEFSDANRLFAPIPTPPIPVEYTLEVRRRTASGSYELLGVIDQPIEPSIEREIGAADQLTFSMLTSDPKIEYFTMKGRVKPNDASFLQPLYYATSGDYNLKGFEIWYYGRDARLKQIFTLQSVQPSHDIGAGALNKVVIVADGPESYLTMYQTQDYYKVTQRRVGDILADIFVDIIADGLITGIYIDATLNIPIDADIAWENLKTAVDNILAHIDGYMIVEVNPLDPTKRTLKILKNETANRPTDMTEVPSTFGLLPRGYGTVEDHVLEQQLLVVYDVFPKVGNHITNNGGLNGTVNEGLAFHNGYTELQSGATAWSFSPLVTDHIRVPYMYASNLAATTISMCVYIGTQTVTDARIISKAQEWSAFELVYDSTNSRLVLTKGTSDYNVDGWVTPNNSVLPEDWYYIQLIWSGSYPDPDVPPLLYIDAVTQTLTNISVGSGDFSYDWGNDLYIGNNADLSKMLIGKLSYFKLYGTALSETLLIEDYQNNAWRRDPSTIDAKVVYENFPVPSAPV